MVSHTVLEQKEDPGKNQGTQYKMYKATASAYQFQQVLLLGMRRQIKGKSHAGMLKGLHFKLFINFIKFIYLSIYLRGCVCAHACHSMFGFKGQLVGLNPCH